MENESGAKIAIRGKGSVKEGKGKSDAAHASNQDEDLHCLIMADTEEKVNKAKKLIHQVIETVSAPRAHDTSGSTDKSQAASTPETQNELKRNQLRELAALNGTLRDDENQACQNCGEIGHRKYDCPHGRNFTANIICRVCGNAGHMARDCPDRARGGNWRDLPPKARIENAADVEYENLMKELGGGDASGPQRQIGWEGQGDTGGESQANVRPWQRGPTGGPAPWAQNRQQSNPAPWANRGGGSYDQGGYNNAPPPPPPPPSGGGPAPWQNRGSNPPPWMNNGGGYGGNSAPPPWQQNHQQYDAPPPPPPPSDVPPPPPPPPQ